MSMPIERGQTNSVCIKKKLINCCFFSLIKFIFRLSFIRACILLTLKFRWDELGFAILCASCAKYSLFALITIWWFAYFLALWQSKNEQCQQCEHNRVFLLFYKLFTRLNSEHVFILSTATHLNAQQIMEIIFLYIS